MYDLSQAPPPVSIGKLKFIQPNWPAPSNIHAFTSTRSGGVSAAPCDSLNLSVGGLGDPTAGLANRKLLKDALNIPSEPIWLAQTHTTLALDAGKHADKIQNADASFTNKINIACVVLTADCLPLLICNKQGTEVAIIHAGWRGLCNGIIENTLNSLISKPENLYIWLGPAISQANFEVGAEVRLQFMEHDKNAAQCFIPSPRLGHFMGDLYALAKLRLQKLGVPLMQVYGGDYCTFAQSELFFSYRRATQSENKGFGNLASLIWMDKDI